MTVHSLLRDNPEKRLVQVWFEHFGQITPLVCFRWFPTGKASEKPSDTSWFLHFSWGISRFPFPALLCEAEQCCWEPAACFTCKNIQSDCLLSRFPRCSLAITWKWLLWNDYTKLNESLLSKQRLWWRCCLQNQHWIHTDIFPACTNITHFEKHCFPFSLKQGEERSEIHRHLPP